MFSIHFFYSTPTYKCELIIVVDKPCLFGICFIETTAFFGFNLYNNSRINNDLTNSGGTTNAVELFLQLANQHPDNPLAQTSLMWLGDYYFGQDKFGQAEQAYTSVLTNRVWKGLDPAIQAQARLSAAQAAIGWKQFGRARERLNELLNDKATPEEFLPEAYFSLGRSFQQTPVADTNSPLASISDALDAFKAVFEFGAGVLQGLQRGGARPAHGIGRLVTPGKQRAAQLNRRQVQRAAHGPHGAGEQQTSSSFAGDAPLLMLGGEQLAAGLQAVHFVGVDGARVAAATASASGPCGSMALCSDAPPGSKPSGLAS